MTNRVVHQKYLEAWLRGESVEFQWCGQVLFDVFNIEKQELSLFSDNRYMFRITPKTVELTEDFVVVNLTDFYADYDGINYETDTEAFGISLSDLFKKYLPRQSN